MKKFRKRPLGISTDADSGAACRRKCGPGRRRAGAPARSSALGGNGDGRRPRQVATSMDDLEETFQRKKRRELEQARMAGAEASRKPYSRSVRGAEKVGRNDPCRAGRARNIKSATERERVPQPAPAGLRRSSPRLRDPLSLAAAQA